MFGQAADESREWLLMVVGMGQIRLGWQNLIAKAKGFTLIEVLIIIVLVAVFISAIGLPILAGIRESELPEIVASAHFLAAEKLEELSSTDYYSIEPASKAAVSGFDGFEREAVVSEVDCSDLTAAGSSTGCIKIEVKVYHSELPSAGISVSALRTVNLRILDAFEFDSVKGKTPRIIPVSGDTYAIAYSGMTGETKDTGWLRTVEIASDGTITDPGMDELEFDAVQGKTPSIVPVSGDIYAIAYSGNTDGTKDTGWLKTVRISAVRMLAGSWGESY